MSLYLEHITQRFGQTLALNDIDLEIRNGEFLAILGPSGCGKTTLLRAIGGFAKPTEGKIRMDDVIYSGNGKMVPVEQRDLGMVFQSFALWPNMTVRQHVEFPMKSPKQKHLTEAQKKEAVDAAIENMGLKPYEDRYPGELSGGQRQRVSLARALVNNPKVIIADEPTGNVDPEMSHEIVGLLTKINNAGTTVIMVTHEHDLVRSFQRRVIVIKNGEVVSDTPDPTHAQFTGENPKADTDMFFFDEDVEIDNVDVLPKDENEEDIFDNLESVVSDESAEEEQGGEQ